MKKQKILILVLPLLLVSCGATGNEVITTSPSQTSSTPIIIKHDLETPKNLSYSEATNTITWEKVNNATSYVLNINDSNYSSTTNSFIISSLEAGKYTIKIAAIGDKNFYNDSTFSTQIEVTFIKQLSAITNIKVVDNCLIWDKVENSDGYEINIDGNKKTVKLSGVDLNNFENKLYQVSIKPLPKNEYYISKEATYSFDFVKAEEVNAHKLYVDGINVKRIAISYRYPKTQSVKPVFYDVYKSVSENNYPTFDCDKDTFYTLDYEVDVNSKLKSISYFDIEGNKIDTETYLDSFKMTNKSMRVVVEVETIDTPTNFDGKVYFHDVPKYGDDPVPEDWSLDSITTYTNEDVKGSIVPKDFFINRLALFVGMELTFQYDSNNNNLTFWVQYSTIGQDYVLPKKLNNVPTGYTISSEFLDPDYKKFNLYDCGNGKYVSDKLIEYIPENANFAYSNPIINIYKDDVGINYHLDTINSGFDNIFGSYSSNTTINTNTDTKSRNTLGIGNGTSGFGKITYTLAQPKKIKCLKINAAGWGGSGIISAFTEADKERMNYHIIKDTLNNYYFFFNGNTESNYIVIQSGLKSAFEGRTRLAISSFEFQFSE